MPDIAEPTEDLFRPVEEWTDFANQLSHVWFTTEHRDGWRGIDPDQSPASPTLPPAPEPEPGPPNPGVPAGLPTACGCGAPFQYCQCNPGCCGTLVNGCDRCQRCVGCGCACRRAACGCMTREPRGCCDRCARCCPCRNACVNCGAVVGEERCGPCRCCDDCCDCGATPPAVWLDSDAFAEVTTRRWLAVEIEVVGVDGRDHVDAAAVAWGVAEVDDGSIKDDAGDDAGFELNTPPAQGDRFAAMVDALADALARDGARVNESCGLHVHVDARDLDPEHIAALIRIYARIEPALFEVVAPSRRDKRHCRPCGPALLDWIESPGMADAPVADRVAHAIYGEASRRLLRTARGQKYRNERYRALNLHSWVYRRTIEVRLHHGTVDAVEIVPWAHLWGTIVDFARAGDPTGLPADPWAALLTLAPTDSVRRHLAAARLRFTGR